LAGAIGFDVIDLDGQRTVGERLCIRRNGDTVFGEFCGSGLSAQLHQIKHWRARGGPAVGDLSMSSNLLKQFEHFNLGSHVVFLAGGMLQFMCQRVVGTSR